MGKAKRTKAHGSAARAAANSGTAVSAQETLPPSNTGTGALGTMDMQAGVLEGLTSLKALTRESSCAAIASLFEKIDSAEAATEAWSAAQRLIAGGLVKKLLPRLVDRVVEVKVQAAGAMRNISAVRDPRVCEIMVQDDCLTPVLTLLDRMSNAQNAVAAATASSSCAPPPETAPSEGTAGGKAAQATTKKIDLEQVVMAQLVATLCNILAAVDAAVGRFTKQGGLQVVMRLLLAEGCRGSAEVFGGALQVLHVATDTNPDLARQLAATPGAVDQLASLVTGAAVTHIKVSTSMRLQAAGILVNLAGSMEEARTAERQAELGGLILPLLLEQMAYDPTSLERACAALASKGSDTKSGTGGDGENMEVDGDGATNSASATESVAGAAAGVASATPMHIATSELASRGGGGLNGGQNGHCPEQEDSGETNMDTDEARKDKARKRKCGNSAQERVVSAVAQPDKDAEVRWKWKLGIAEPLKLAAEVMTNLCALAAAEGEGLGEEDEEWGSDDEDVMDQAANSGSGSKQDATGIAAIDEGSVLLQVLADGGAMQRTVTALGALLSPTPRDRISANGETGSGADGGTRLALPSGTAGDLADLRATVALCAANLVQNLPTKALGMDPYLLWSELCRMCEAAAERAPSCVETLTGVMWGLVRRAGPAVAAGIQRNPTAAVSGPPPLLLSLSNPEKTQSFEARVNIVGILGALGAAVPSTASQSGGSGEGDVGLGRALVHAMEDPHVLVQAEALNAVMDVFGDDDRDAAFRACGAPAALVAGVPAFKRKVKQEGKAVGRDALCHLKETALNAVRFVKYKQAAAAYGRGSG